MTNTKTILNDKARLTVKETCLAVNSFQTDIPQQNMIKTRTGEIESMAEEPQRAGKKEKRQTSKISDAALKCEGRSLRWNGIIYEPSNNIDAMVG